MQEKKTSPKVITRINFENWPNDDIFSIQKIVDEIYIKLSLIRANSETYEILYLCSGTLLVNFGGIEHIAKKGDTVLLPRHIPHRIVSADSLGVRCLHTTVCGEYCDTLYNLFSLHNECVFPTDISAQLKDMIAFAKSEENLQKRVSFCLGKISEIFHILSSFTEQKHLPVNKSISFLKVVIERHLDKFYTNEELAKFINCSVSPMVKKFKAEYGITPMQFQLETKLNEAKKALIGGDMSIKEISASLGFCDATHFSTTFKKRFGILPRKVRKSSSY